jgi:hypothetical protein
MALVDSINTGNLPDPTQTYGRLIDNAVQYAVPTTGQTVTAGAAIQRIVINPAGALLALTITFPPTPLNGQLFSWVTTQAVTTLTLTSSATINNGPSAQTAGQTSKFVYVSAQTTWFPTL